MRQICLDTETTGTKAEEGDRIVEIGCFEIVGRTLSDDPSHVYWQYINPERDVPADAVAIHGLTNEFLADKPVFADIANDFLKFVEGAELVIHNAAFDVGFLNMELARIGKGKIEDYCPSIVDSLAIARQKYPGVRNSLDALCSRYEIDNSKRTLHGALLDSQILADVYLMMTGGQTSIKFSMEGENQNQSGEAGIQRVVRQANKLRVVLASDEELMAHESRLDLVQKKGGSCLWRG